MVCAQILRVMWQPQILSPHLMLGVLAQSTAPARIRRGEIVDDVPGLAPQLSRRGVCGQNMMRK